MASDYYLHLEDSKIGAVKGEALDQSFENDIQLLQFAIQVDSPDSGSGSPTSAPTFHDVELTAPAGGPSATLFQLICENADIKVAKVTCRKATGTGAMQKFMTWEFTACRLTSFRQETGENGRLVDVYRLRYTKVEVNAWRQKRDGSLEGPRNVIKDRAK